MHTISEDKCEKPVTRSEALGIFKNFNCLESCFIALVWNNILDRFNAVSKTLQSANADLSTVVELYQSLIKFIDTMRMNFSLYEKKATEKCGIKEYSRDTSRRRKRKIPYDCQKNDNDENLLSGSDDMRINVFYVILDSLLADLNKRIVCYTGLNNKFGFLTNLHALSPEIIAQKALNLQSSYSDDLELTLDIECQHLAAYLRTLNVKELSAFELCKLLHEQNFLILYPNVNIALRILLCMMISNCSGERSFSVLRRVKNYLRSTQRDERLNALALLCIEAELNREIDYNSIINEFAIKKARKVLL